MLMVSIICPTYNQGKYLRQGLDSILAQKVSFQYEILIGEDCSPDNTNEILKEYEEKYPDLIKVYHREKNLKQARNIHGLFVLAKGKYVITLDLDDFWIDEYKLSKQVDFLEKHQEYIGVAHDLIIIDQNSKILKDTQQEIEEKYLDRAFTLKNMEETTFVFQTGTFLYRNIWKEKKDYSILYRADDTVVDLTINTMLLLQSNIFIMSDKMSAYRLVISTGEDATNARSVGQKNLALDFYKSCKQLRILYFYFEKKADHSNMWSNLVLSYLKNMFKSKDRRYHFFQWMEMFMLSSWNTKKKVAKFISGSVLRKVHLSK